jgi:hypothetical protein
LDNTTRLALQAIVRGLHRGGAITRASVADIVVQLQRASAARHVALDAKGAQELLSLADCIEIEAEEA